MNISDILRVLKRDSRTYSQFRGVYAKDTMPLLMNTKPSLLVVNTDVAAGPGLHWVSFYVPDDCDTVEFFDSLGHLPSHYSERFEHFLLINGKQYKYQKMRLQNFHSDTCGHYCMYYALRRCNGWTMERILDVFDIHSKAENDQIVRRSLEDGF